MQNQRSVLPSMLALPRGGTLRADYSLIAIYLSICAAESQYAGGIVALGKPKSRYGNGGTGCPVRPVRAGSFAVNHSGELPLRAAGAQEGRQPAVFHPLVNLPFSLLPWVQTVDCVSRKRTRQSGYLSVSFSAFSQFTDRLLLHIPATFRRRGITVPRNSVASANQLYPQEWDNRYR